MAFSWMLVGVAEVSAPAGTESRDRAAAMSTMYIIRHTMKVDIPIGK